MTALTRTSRRIRPWQIAMLLIAALAVTLFAWTSMARAAVSITAAPDGGAISLDTSSAQGIASYTAIGTIVITEQVPGDFPIGDNQTLVLNAPAGFEFESLGEAAVSGDGSDGVVITNLVFASGSVTIDFNVAGAAGIDAITISGLNTRPTNTTPTSGNIVVDAASSFAIVGVDGDTNFGTLTSVPGAPAAITLDGPASAIAGAASDNFTITVRDQFGNATDVGAATTFNIGGSNIGTATLVPVSPIEIASGASAATFTYSQTATGNQGVSASFAAGDTDLDGKASNTHGITVNPAGYSAAHSTVAVTGDSSITYSGTTTVTLTARDQASDPVPTLDTGTVTFVLTGTGSSTGTFGATTHEGEGVYQSTFTGTGAGVARTFEGRVDGVAAALGGGPTITVTPKALTVAAGVTIDDKVYDGTNAATLVFNTPALSGVESDDVVSVNPATGSATFASVDVKPGVAVTFTGLALQGADAGNYTLTQPVGLAANITPLALTVTGVTASNKVYDGNTTATVYGGLAWFAGQLDGDSVYPLGNATGTFADKNIGTDKPVTVSGITAGGTDGGNYTVTQLTVLADITPLALTVTGVTAPNKVYDGTTTATVDANSASFVGVVDGDTVTRSGTATGAFENDRVGTGMTVTVSGITAAGTHGGNYTVTQPTVVADITPKAITVTGVTVENKVYDGTLVATLGYVDETLNGVRLGDAPVGLYIPDATATFASEDAGSGISVTVSGLSLGGERASNYTLTQPEGLTANITAAPLTVTGVTAQNKVYDGTMTATVNADSAEFEGVLGDDSVGVGGTATGSFEDEKVGIDKLVTIAGITAGGADGGNYAVTQPTATASITAVPSAPSGSAPTPTPTPTATVTPTTETAVVEQDEPTEVQAEGSDGSTATVNAPANALPAGSTLTGEAVGDVDELTSQAPPPGGTDTMLAFVIEARDADGNLIEGDFAEPIELEFNVPASSVPAGATSGQMVLAFWNGSSWTEVEASVTVNADGSLTINASVEHFTMFAVQHQPYRGLLIPPPTWVMTSSVWGGGGYGLLDAAVGTGNTAWVLGETGFHGYTVGVPSFVNANFQGMFPSGLTAYTVVTVTRWDLAE